MSDTWIKRQKPEEENGKWAGQPWPTSPWALFRDTNGVECLAEKLTADDYVFFRNENKIDLDKLCMFKELNCDDPLILEHL